MKRSLDALIRRHEVEETLEAFGVPGMTAADGSSALDWGFFEAMRIGGEALTEVSVSASASQHGVVARRDGDALHVGSAGGRDALLTWLTALMEENPRVFLARPPLAVHIPATDAVPDSHRWLDRLYEGDFLPREKKPFLVDLRRSRGAYMASVDRNPLVILEAMSQIATLPAGFGPPEVEDAIDNGEFDDAVCSSAWFGSAGEAARGRYERAVGQHLSSELKHFAYANSGAEANEKAFSLARLHGPGGSRIIAFEGSFHGRTLLSLYATWNKAKREPYQIQGHEVAFVPFPVSGDPDHEPVVEREWLERWARASEEPPGDSPISGDAGEAEEIASLNGVHALLEQGDICAVIVEPMQSEGGDNYGTNRFYNGLRQLTRTHGVPLIIDEVQTGFGLGGSFAWHTGMDLRRPDGSPDHPDCVTWAKKSQVGCVSSVWPDSFPTDGHGVSAIRGALHAEIVANDTQLEGHVARVRQLLAALESDMPKGLCTGGRLRGYAFAVDLPTAEIADKLVAQRFYRGAMVYKAGSYTLRYRLSRAFDADRTAGVFEVIRASLQTVIDAAGGVGAGGDDLFERMSGSEMPEWDGRPEDDEAPRLRPAADVGIRRLSPGEWGDYRDAIIAIEEAAYEPERRDEESFLASICEHPEGIVLVAEEEGALQGFSFAAPLEHFSGVTGPDTDPHLNRGDTLYSADVTVSVGARGRGIGAALKDAQVREALQARVLGSERPRYAFITGRNRIGHTMEMGAINGRYGAYPVRVYSGQYGAADGEAVYYRIALRRMDRRAFNERADRVPQRTASSPVNLAHGVVEPLGWSEGPIRDALQRGHMDGGLLTKLTLSNFVTPNLVRYLETMQMIRPASTAHMYMTSGRDEMTDKAIRTLRSHRPEGAVCVGFQGGYWGHTTGASRSLTDWAGHPQADRLRWFDWPHVPHPGHAHGVSERAGRDALIAIHDSAAAADSEVSAREEALESWLREADLSRADAAQIRREGNALRIIERIFVVEGAERILGVFAEGIQEMTGSCFTDRFWAALSANCQAHDVPIVVDECASGMFRSGSGQWWTDSLSVEPDVVLSYAGGQIGHVFVSDRYYLGKPLQLISTWDGDEVSAIRNLAVLRSLHGSDVASEMTSFAEQLGALWDRLDLHARMPLQGQGGFQAFEAPQGQSEVLREHMRLSGFELGVGFKGRLLMIPPVRGMDDEMTERLCGALEEALTQLGHGAGA
jgi:4-aminobutyrate aminotransferase-like enzyme